MNVLDILIAIPMAYLAWKGYKRGLVFEVASLAGVLLGCWAAVHFSQYVAELIGLEGDGAVLIAFFVTFAAVLLLSMLLAKCIQGLFKMVKMGFVDRLVGALIGFLKAVCIAGVVLSYVVLVDHRGLVLKESVKESSVFYKPVVTTGDTLVRSLKTYVAQRRYERAMNEKEGS